MTPGVSTRCSRFADWPLWMLTLKRRLQPPDDSSLTASLMTAPHLVMESFVINYEVESCFAIVKYIASACAWSLCLRIYTYILIIITGVVYNPLVENIVPEVTTSVENIVPEITTPTYTPPRGKISSRCCWRRYNPHIWVFVLLWAVWDDGRWKKKNFYIITHGIEK